MTEGTRHRRHSRRPLRVAREHRRTYDSDGHSHRGDARTEARDDARDGAGGDARGEDAGGQAGGGHARGYTPQARHTALREGVEALADLDLDPLDETAIRTELKVAQQAIRQLTAFRARAAGVLEQRALRTAGPGREQQALGASRRRLADDLRLRPSQAKRDGETGRRIADHPAAEDAMRAGDLPPEHARVLAETLQALDPGMRPQAEEELLEAGRREDARTFGRTCRRLLARVDAEAAQAAQDRRNARRGLRMTDTPDGMTALHGQGSGVDAEFVHTAIHAFSRPDVQGQHRTPEQRNWDALVDICRAALDAGSAPSNHGVRPHFLVTVPEDTIRRGEGVAEAAWTGPLPWSEVRRLLADSGVSRVITDPAGLPVEAGEGVRSVPAGLRKLLHVRDTTCAGDGCDVPAAWCQIMHLDVPYRLGGRLRPETAAPGCSFHHRMLDRHGWSVTWDDGHPIVHHPDRPPRQKPNPPRSPASNRPPGSSGPPGSTRPPASTRPPGSSGPPGSAGPPPSSGPPPSGPPEPPGTPTATRATDPRSSPGPSPSGGTDPRPSTDPRVSPGPPPSAGPPPPAGGPSSTGEPEQPGQRTFAQQLWDQTPP